MKAEYLSQNDIVIIQMVTAIEGSFEK
jgi:hypothetical protein